MLKFILLVIFIFLATRMVIRVVVRLLRGGIFFFRRNGVSSKGSSPSTFSSRDHLDEADYEVIESHLSDKAQDVG